MIYNQFTQWDGINELYVLLSRISWNNFTVKFFQTSKLHYLSTIIMLINNVIFMFEKISAWFTGKCYLKLINMSNL